MGIYYNASCIVEKMIAVGIRLYNQTPVGIQFVFLPAARILSLLRLCFCDQWILDGMETMSKQRLVIRYTGTENNKNYLEKLAYGKFSNGTYLGKKLLWQCFRERDKRQFDLMITEIPRFLQVTLKKTERFLVPCWISGDVDISEKISSLVRKNNTLSNNLRRIKKHGLSYEVTHEITHLEEFYRNMYLPYVISRWDKLSIIASYDELKKSFRKGYLVLIKKGEQVIAGQMVYHGNDTPTMTVVGIKNGNLEYLKMGALSACYYFTLQHLQNRGYHRVYLGNTRAFLKDGVLQHKKYWGLRVLRPVPPLFLIELTSKTAGVDGFLLNNPFICLENNHLSGTAFVKSNTSPASTPEAVQKSIYVNGLSKFVIHKIVPHYQDHSLNGNKF